MKYFNFIFTSKKKNEITFNNISMEEISESFYRKDLKKRIFDKDNTTPRRIAEDIENLANMDFYESPSGTKLLMKKYQSMLDFTKDAKDGDIMKLGKFKEKFHSDEYLYLVLPPKDFEGYGDGDFDDDF